MENLGQICKTRYNFNVVFEKNPTMPWGFIWNGFYTKFVEEFFKKLTFLIINSKHIFYIRHHKFDCNNWLFCVTFFRCLMFEWTFCDKTFIKTMAPKASKHKAANGYTLPNKIPEGTILTTITKKKFRLGKSIGKFFALISCQCKHKCIVKLGYNLLYWTINICLL